VVGAGEEHGVKVERQADGSYQAELCGHFRPPVAGDDPFRVRLLWLFLRLLEETGRPRQGGRTHAERGRAPFVSQVQVAEWFDLPQPNVSRIEGYWRAADWPNLLSLPIGPLRGKAAEVLTAELRARIVGVLASHPWWDMQAVYEHMRQQEVAVTYEQVRQAAQESGWRHLRETLAQRYHFSAEDVRARDDWLVKQLLAMQEQLLARLEELEGITAEEQVAVDELRSLATELGVAAAPPLKALPWLSAWGYELLPVAALFGVVKSSGVVGVDEKYVLVPKNDKPAGKMRRWMYVYLAVDVYTYDLLHIAIYAHNDKENALAFLLALRAKGYHPRVVVTDLRRDYGPDIAQVLPQAEHTCTCSAGASVTCVSSTPCRISAPPAVSFTAATMPRRTPRWRSCARLSSVSLLPRPGAPLTNATKRLWGCATSLSRTRQTPLPSSTSWSATGLNWSTPSRVSSSPRPTTPWNW
jgi:hypothetical protein